MNKKILIFSSNYDTTTCIVIQWLTHGNIPWERINAMGDNSVQVEFQLDSEQTVFTLVKDGMPSLDVKDVSAVWYRRTENVGDVNFNKYFDIAAANLLSSNLRNERRDIVFFLYEQLREKKWINHPTTSSVNKLKQLQAAHRLGIDVPKTILSSDKKTLIDFIKNCKKTITKPINNFNSFKHEGETYTIYANLVKDDDLLFFSDRIFPCLLQEYIEKQYEIRSFYLNGKFYSMAIFSQKDEKTRVDFRRYNQKKMNRRVPYKLPESVEYKLDKLMKELNLNSGSFDLIYGMDKKYHFLEVNPVGQFGMVSVPCNYYLEKIVAEELISNMNK